MASFVTDWKTAGAATGAAWMPTGTLVSDLSSSNNVRCTDPDVPVGDNNPSTGTIQTSQFSFDTGTNAVPAGARIIDIEYEYEGMSGSGLVSYTTAVQLATGGTGFGPVSADGTFAFVESTVAGNMDVTGVTAAQVRDSAFGFNLWATVDIGSAAVLVDFFRARVTWEPGPSTPNEFDFKEIETMDLRDLIARPLSAPSNGAAKTISSTSTTLITSAPAGARAMLLTVKTTPICVRFDAGTASTANGHDYPVGGPYIIPFPEDVLEAITAIRNGAADATVYYEFLFQR